MNKKLEILLKTLLFGFTLSSAGFAVFGMQENKNKAEETNQTKATWTQSSCTPPSPKKWDRDALISAVKKEIKNMESTCKNKNGHYFYHDNSAGKKVTVGFGWNVENNKDGLKDLTIYKSDTKKPLMFFEKVKFLKEMHAKTNKELKNYYITDASAEEHLEKDISDRVQRLCQMFKEKNEKDPRCEKDFLKLPFCMQIVALDIDYNVGNLKNFPKFSQALATTDFEQVCNECCVNLLKESCSIKRNFHHLLYLKVGEKLQKDPTFDIKNLKNNFKEQNKIFEEIADQFCKNIDRAYKASNTKKPLSQKDLEKKKQCFRDYCFGRGNYSRLSAGEMIQNLECLSFLQEEKEAQKNAFFLSKNKTDFSCR